MINKISVKLPSQLPISKITAYFDDIFGQLDIKSTIEAENFELEPTIENTINEIKANHLKIITYFDMNISAITLNKPSSSSEHLKYDLIPQILLQSPGRSPQFTKYFSSMHPKGNTKLQIQKWWVPIRSALYLSFFVILFSIPLHRHTQVSNR